jgi:hypothetical protein
MKEIYFREQKYYLLINAEGKAGEDNKERKIGVIETKQQRQQ